MVKYSAEKKDLESRGSLVHAQGLVTPATTPRSGDRNAPVTMKEDDSDPLVRCISFYFYLFKLRSRIDHLSMVYSIE